MPQKIRDMGSLTMPRPKSSLLRTTANRGVGTKKILRAALARRGAFTLVELMVSMTVLVILMVVIFTLLGSATNIWQRSSAKVSAFQGSRASFESMTRKLSQATLNTYWDYVYPNTSGTVAPTSYGRQSELAFVSGPAAGLTGNSAATSPTHAVFFTAPVGYSNQYPALNQLLNACGYYVQFGTDKPYWPAFLSSGSSTIQQRWRYRLMEMWQPSESLSIYSYTSGSSSYAGTGWIPVLSGTAAPARVLAENVIALVILPKLPEGTGQNQDSTGKLLAPGYSYNSRDPAFTYSDQVSGQVISTQNQLPPQVQAIMVAIDEPSAIRLALNSGTNPPPLVSSALFQTSANLSADLAVLQTSLSNQRINYRIFSTSVSIQGSKWSSK